jgi:lipoyl-dependent peroxiredoxin
VKRSANAIWKGNLAEGSGTLSSQSGAIAAMPYSAHAGCFAMQLSHFLAENGTPASSLDAKAIVTVDPDPAGGFTIKGSAIELVGTVPGIDAEKFSELAEKAKATCPVSRALGAIDVTLSARLA